MYYPKNKTSEPVVTSVLTWTCIVVAVAFTKFCIGARAVAALLAHGAAHLVLVFPRPSPAASLRRAAFQVHGVIQAVVNT